MSYPISIFLFPDLKKKSELHFEISALNKLNIIQRQSQNINEWRRRHIHI